MFFTVYRAQVNQNSFFSFFFAILSLQRINSSRLSTSTSKNTFLYLTFRMIGEIKEKLLLLYIRIWPYSEGSTVGGDAQADIPVTDDFSSRVVYID